MFSESESHQYSSITLYVLYSVPEKKKKKQMTLKANTNPESNLLGNYVLAKAQTRGRSVSSDS
jgi:hypothetical protein